MTAIMAEFVLLEHGLYDRNNGWIYLTAGAIAVQ